MKFSSEEPFFQKTSEKSFVRREGGVPSKKVAKNFVEEPSSLSLISGIEKIYASEGYVTILRLKFFVSQCRKIS